VNDWLDQAVRRLAEATGQPPGDFALDQAAIDALLDLARVAAHDSGERTNAPLASYLVGLAHGRTPAAQLADLTREASGSGP